jgi:hypothetical protein
VLVAVAAACVECGDDSTSSGTGGSAGTSHGGNANGGSVNDGGMSGASEGGQGAFAGAGGTSPEETLRGPCTAFCEAVAETMCPNDDGTNECIEGCLFTGSLGIECVPAFELWLSCSIDSGMECNADGRAEAASCADEDETFTLCVSTL